MPEEKPKKKKIKVPSAQSHLPFAEVKSDTVIMKDGTLRAVMMVSSINFALKNEDEQNAIVSSYVSFLNGLDFPLQIVVQSRQLYIKPYLEKLLKQEREQANELLRAQIADYRSFVSELVSLGKIMSKQFFVVVPYDPLSNKKRGFWSRISEVAHPAVTVKLKEERFQFTIWINDFIPIGDLFAVNVAAHILLTSKKELFIIEADVRVVVLTENQI